MEFLILGGIALWALLSGGKKTNPGDSGSDDSGTETPGIEPGTDPEYRDQDGDTPQGKPETPPADKNLYRLANPTGGYDPFYDYSDDWSRTRLTYSEGKFGIPASGSGTLLRFRMLPETFVARHTQIQIYPLWSKNNFYRFQFDLEVVNPFDAAVTLRNFRLWAQPNNPVIMHIGNDMFPLFNSSISFPAGKNAADKKKVYDAIFNGVLKNAYTDFPSKFKDGFDISTAEGMVIPAQSSKIFRVRLSTPDNKGFFSLLNWTRYENRTLSNMLGTSLFDINFTFKIDLSPEVFNYHLRVHKGKSPAIVPEKWWEFQYVDGDVSNFESKEGALI